MSKILLYYFSPHAYPRSAGEPHGYDLTDHVRIALHEYLNIIMRSAGQDMRVFLADRI